MFTPPALARRNSRATTYRCRSTSNTSRTVPRTAVGASAYITIRLSCQRGTVPYRAKVIASMTVDLPGAGRPDQGEVVGVGEVDGRLIAERREAVHVQQHRAHDGPSACTSRTW